MKKIVRSEEEWKAILGEEKYHILRKKGTEPAFSGRFNFHKEEGTFCCGACGEPLFSSHAKFDSGCGWPAFFEELNEEKILKQWDYSYGMKRVEILCAACESHLGHVFPDGPEPTGLRYCVNSLSLDFSPEKANNQQSTES